MAERLRELPLELTARRQFLDDVGPADQLAFDEDLRNRRPTRERGELLAEARVGEDVDGRDRCARAAKRRERALRVAACGEGGRPLHEEGDGLGLDDLLDLAAEVGHSGSFRGDAELMDCAVGERTLEGGVDQLVLFDQREAGEARARDGDLEVVAAARAVLDVELCRVGKGFGE